MDWVLIIGFIVLGITLIIIEIVFVPGTTIVGIGGLACMGYGIYVAFTRFGTSAGVITIIITVVFCVSALIYSLKTRSWEKFSLKSSIDSKFNEEFEQDLQVGEIGESISSLKPIGKALFNEQEVEVRSMGGYVREKSKVRIIKIEQTKIFVEPITEA